MFNGMSNSIEQGVGRGMLLLSKNNACFISGGFGDEAVMCGRDGALNLVITELADEDGMRFDDAFSNDLVEQ